MDSSHSPKISNEQHNHPLGTGRSFREAWEYWECFITPEPISEELREMIRQDLQKQWYSARLGKFRFWTHTNWARLDSEMIILDDELSITIPPGRVDLFCNRPSAFYWLQSSQSAGSDGVFRFIPAHVFATIFGEWYRHYDNQPNIEFGHFLPNPIRVTERGPTTIHGIVKAHIPGLEKAEAILHKHQQEESSFHFPEQVKAGNYRIHPLYKALILMIDRNVLIDRMEEFRRLIAISDSKTLLIFRAS